MDSCHCPAVVLDVGEAMSDRELIELAAKAAGVEYTGEDYARKAIGGGHYENFPWNPLEDDGDALRLAVKLKVMVDIDEHNTSISKSFKKYELSGLAKVLHTDDAYAATRRAIVTAAAEIGSAME